MTTTAYAIVAICISTIALIVATKNYRRKSGLLVRGSFSVASDVDCNDVYVSNLFLENLKDRAMTVFAVYLRVGHSYYIEIDNFEEKPLLLKAFEAYQKEYGPIQFYGINNNRMNLNELLRNPKVKKRLVLSTADGKYIVPSPIRSWSPVGDFFKNHMTAVVHPVRTVYKEKYVGANIKYVIELVTENGSEEVILIRPEDFRRKRFRNFHLTKECLETKESLEAYLQEQLDSGMLICKKYVVHA